MVGGYIKRDERSTQINNKNVFAALETLKKKKKSSNKNQKGSSNSETRESDPIQLTWVPTLLNKSWADVDDDDDDVYFITAPLLPVWESAHKQDDKEEISHFAEEDSESEDDGLIEGDYDVEDEPEEELESSVPIEPISKNPTPASVALKDPERQLSKKELKKKELEELDALLQEFSVSNNEENNSVPVEKNVATDLDGKENTSALANIKSSKKKKVKKEKSAKDPNASDEALGAESELNDDSVSSEIDIKEKLKKMVSKRKKSTKDAGDAPSKAAAIEAAARTAKLAAAKKKEKSHYNQQPVR